jgi:hypothetical protein
VADLFTRAGSYTEGLWFFAPSDHAAILNYAARVRLSGNSAIVATQQLGKPTPDANGMIVADLGNTLAQLSPGLYTVSVVITRANGNADSAPSSPFRVS